MGIAAARIMEKYNVPVLVLSKIIKNVVRWHNIRIKAKRVYDYIKWPSDFKLTETDLQKIDNDIENMIKKTGIEIYDIKENINKHKLII